MELGLSIRFIAVGKHSLDLAFPFFRYLPFFSLMNAS